MYVHIRTYKQVEMVPLVMKGKSKYETAKGAINAKSVNNAKPSAKNVKTATLLNPRRAAARRRTRRAGGGV